VVLHLLGRVVLGIGRGREPDGWCVGEEEEERPLIQELGTIRVANETKRCACVSGASTRRRGEPMKHSGAHACVSGVRVCIRSHFETLFKLKRGVPRAYLSHECVHLKRGASTCRVTAMHQRSSASLRCISVHLHHCLLARMHAASPPPAHACSVVASRACLKRPRQEHCTTDTTSYRDTAQRSNWSAQ
jgi:hypothetical protein